MFILKGQYNIAKVMLPEESLLEEKTKGQIQGFLNNPAFGDANIAIMPDCHYGAGSCIGFTMTLNDYTIPNVIGVDIGCGVLSVCIGMPSIVLEDLDRFIHDNIASGFDVNPTDPKNPDTNTRALIHAVERTGCLIETNTSRNIKAIGSLGGGNHFIELGVDEESQKWLTIHTGSRKFGMDVCNYYQKMAETIMKKFFVKGNDENLAFLTKEIGAVEYAKDMETALFFAEMNRKLLAEKILDYLKVNRRSLLVSSVHNYIDFNQGMIRKGAISALAGEKVVIPFNMEDGLIIGKGKGNKVWNWSAPHGAGRILSRKKAKAQLSVEKMQQGLKKAGVFTTSATAETLDEAPGAYKDAKMIIDAIEDTVEVERFVKPVYNFKAGG